MRLPYNPKLKQLARELRNNSTLAEVLLWQQLKDGQRKGYDFHRQKPIDESHGLKGPEDEERQRRLEALGIRFLRFEDSAVKSDTDAIVQAIDNWIEANEQKL